MKGPYKKGKNPKGRTHDRSHLTSKKGVVKIAHTTSSASAARMRWVAMNIVRVWLMFAAKWTIGEAVKTKSAVDPEDAEKCSSSRWKENCDCAEWESWEDTCAATDKGMHPRCANRNGGCRVATVFDHNQLSDGRSSRVWVHRLLKDPPQYRLFATSLGALASARRCHASKTVRSYCTLDCAAVIVLPRRGRESRRKVVPEAGNC